MTTLKTKFAASSAKKLRTTMTEAERKLWFRIKNRQLLGFKFVRQQPVGPCIADFACREADLIVEIDGSQHAESQRDEQRTRKLNAYGYEVIRFWNTDVLTNLDGVFEALAERLNKAPSPGLRFAKSDLSPEGRGVKRPQLSGRTT